MQAFLAGRELVLLFTLFCAAVSDLRSYRVPNRLFLFGAGVLLFLTLLSAPKRLPGALGGALLISVCLFPLYALHFLGGGDVKLAALVLLYEPGKNGFWILWYVCLSAAALSLLKVMRQRMKKGLLRKRSGSGMDRGLGSIPMAPCFFLGSLFWILTNRLLR